MIAVPGIANGPNLRSINQRDAHRLGNTILPAQGGRHERHAGGSEAFPAEPAWRSLQAEFRTRIIPEPHARLPRATRDLIPER
ncbi:hypothetical protein [Burkholderia sp. 22PA0106]|uniref:hypothetical protein n=1 Tax=Burkholderia sp. 22PA0106 TaxID=3237371 RepID=UPI0039C18D14